jgi:CBS domain-containing protein
MKVARIYTRNVISAPRSSTLQEAALIMRDRHVGSLLVTEDEPTADHAIGIVTDRDMAVLAVAEGCDPQNATLADIMTPRIAAIGRDADVHDAMAVMRRHGVRRLAVTGEDGSIVGVLSLDDVIDALAVELSGLADVIRSERGREAGALEQERPPVPD